MVWQSQVLCSLPAELQLLVICLGSSVEPQHGMLSTGEMPTVSNTQSEVRGVGGRENLKNVLVH